MNTDREMRRMHTQDYSNLTVLFVDDEQETLDSLRRNLFREKYKKRFADSAAKGLEIIENEPIHVVVSDIQMPDMDGFSFLKEVRNRYPEIVRMVLSGMANLDKVIELINSGGIYRYVAKPVHRVKELRATILQAAELYEIKSQRWSLLKTLEEKNSELSIWQNKMERELSLAAALQRKTLSLDPFINSDLEVFSAYEPHISIGGDFFDVISLPNGKTCLFIGDVAGHGVAPAMIAMLSKVVIEESIRSFYDQGLDVVCNTIHRRFLQYVQSPEAYATMFMAIYDPEHSEWECLNCGHPVPLFTGLPAGFSEDKGGFPVGLSVISGDICSRQDIVKVDALPGSAMLLYTDGLSEARCLDETECADKAISTTAFARQAGLCLNPARLIMDNLQGSGRDTSQDDCSVLHARVIDPKNILWSGSVELDRKFVEDLSEQISSMLAQKGWPQSGFWGARMVVHEFGMNIIDHSSLADDRKFYLRVTSDGDLCKILFRDNGREWSYLSDPDRPLDSERGRGMEIIDSICAEKKLFRRKDENHALFLLLRDSDKNAGGQD